MVVKSYAFLSSACMIGAALAVCAALPGILPGAPPFFPPPPSSSSAARPGFRAFGRPVGQPFSPAGPGRSLCPVSGLPPITDPQALAFENFTGPVVDTRDLNHHAFSALLKFVREIRSVGGIITLRSAYRPPAYQVHLQQVWDKWMQLRYNHSYACQDFRAQVRAEFDRHHLIESQRPVDDSDHTRGLAFDATVVLPRILHLGRRRVTLSLDRLARFAGLRRPDIRHDPVHFKYVG